MKFFQELTLLSEEEIQGVNGVSRLDVLQKYGTKCAITDLAILTGADYSDNDFAPDDDSMKGRTSFYYTRSSDINGNVKCVYCTGGRVYAPKEERTGAIRPALKSSAFFDLISLYRVSGYNGTEEVEYGEYPQYAPSSDVQELLEQEFKKGYLHKTGKNYRFNSTMDSFCSFRSDTYDEYEYKGNKFVRIKAYKNKNHKHITLSNGESYRAGDNVWVEVSPVRWLINYRTKILLSKRGILSGIRFYTDFISCDDFLMTEMKKYLDNIMLEDLSIKEEIKLIHFYQYNI